MQLRFLCKSKIHHATVTQADLDYVGSIGIDATLMRMADILHRLGEIGVELDARARRVVEAYRGRSLERLRDNRAARRLERLGYERDLDLCLAEDAVPVVPRLVEGVFVRETTEA